MVEVGFKQLNKYCAGVESESVERVAVRSIGFRYEHCLIEMDFNV